MKSAYEIALERLEKESGPAQKLSERQKGEIAEIEKQYDAKVAAERLRFDERISSATSSEEVDQIRRELADTLASLEAQRDQQKEAVWNSE